MMLVRLNVLKQVVSFMRTGMLRGGFGTALFFLFLMINGAMGQSFTATTSNNPVAVGDQFQITYSLQGNGGNFRAPTFSDFNTLVGPSQSTSMQIVNGSIS